MALDPLKYYTLEIVRKTGQVRSEYLSLKIHGIQQKTDTISDFVLRPRKIDGQESGTERFVIVKAKKLELFARNLYAASEPTFRFKLKRRNMYPLADDYRRIMVYIIAGVSVVIIVALMLSCVHCCCRRGRIMDAEDRLRR